jgi:hypothetical protein
MGGSVDVKWQESYLGQEQLAGTDIVDVTG